MNLKGVYPNRNSERDFVVGTGGYNGGTEAMTEQEDAT